MKNKKPAFQLKCTGERKYFSDEGTFYHKYIFESKEDITDEVKEKFIEACCNGGDNDLLDLKRETVQLHIIELIYVEK